MDTYMEQFNETVPVNGIIGWIETDGVPGKSDGDEEVFVDDVIENDVVVYTLCYNCTCDDEIQCQQQICEPCKEGEEQYYVEDDCCPKCHPVVQETCQLRHESKVIEFHDEEGTLCVTPEEVDITYCAGACHSEDQSSIYSFDGETIVHNKDCKCCTGEGNLQAQQVMCGQKIREIKIKMFHTCGCNQCEGAEEQAAAAKKSASEKKPKHARRSISHSATLPDEYKVSKNQKPDKPISKKDDIAFNSKLVNKVDFEPTKAKYALMDSPSSYTLNKQNSYILMKMSIDRKVDSISFNTHGKGTVRVDVIDKNDKFLLKKKVTEDGSHSYSLTGKPLDVMLTLLDDSKPVDISKLIVKYKPEKADDDDKKNM
jgi:hypothetical protein